MITPQQLIQGPQQGEQATLDRPLEHLVACHRRIEERLRTLERVGDHLTTKKQEALEALEACFGFFDSNGAWHTADEEESVFPRLAPGLKPQERAFIEKLEGQHREAEQVYSNLRRVAGELRGAEAIAPVLIADYTQTVARLCRLYRVHIHSEDQTLIEFGRRLLDRAELSAISSEMKRRRSLSR